ncbi:MAG: DUF4405 domain-containing protein [Coriobacteriales bacterium]|jgi:hypothetical protein|nr:DUF4405 domain-containing protein [Coriobacteriales bacterium]
MRLRTRLIIDAAALLVYLVAANPLITGLAVHEWAGLALVIVFMIHTTVNLDTIAQAVRHQISQEPVVNLIVDAALLIVFMVVTVSGVMVSRHILPALGFVAQGYFFWNPLHAIAAKILLALLIAHVALHSRWVSSLFATKKGTQDVQDTRTTVDQ